jgi:hypothetical protein
VEEKARDTIGMAKLGVAELPAARELEDLGLSG